MHEAVMSRVGSLRKVNSAACKCFIYFYIQTETTIVSTENNFGKNHVYYFILQK